MNEIEKMFYKAYENAQTEENELMFELEPQKVIGIYKVDFLYGNCAVEIDGYEFHKTKEQREKDYKRERYLQRNEFIPVRFTGTEIYLNSEECFKELNEIAENIDYTPVSY